MSGQTIEIYGIPGNALGAYLTGAEITVNGNAQDAVGDTMNDGTDRRARGYRRHGGLCHARAEKSLSAGAPDTARAFI